MSRWNALERFVVPFAGVLLTTVALLYAEEPAKKPRAAALPASAKAADAPGAAPETAGVAEIRAAARAYSKAIHDGDFAAAAAFWNPAGDYIDSSGRKHNVQELFARRLSTADPNSGAGKSPEKPAGEKATPGGSPNAAPAIGAIRLVTPDVAIEDGSWTLPGAEFQPDSRSRFTAVWTRSEGKWRLDSLRESRVNNESPAERLAPLAWLVGEWEATHGALTVRMSCEWSPDKNFLIRELKAGPAPDRMSSMGTQRIGWDPIGGRIKSWLFEADGGWGDATWSHAGDAWTVRASVVHPNGMHSSANTSYAPLDGDHIRVESSDVTVGGQTRPDLKLDFYRKQP